nr:DUF4175 family protein [Ketogulonicigenium vulgare]
MALKAEAAARAFWPLWVAFALTLALWLSGWRGPWVFYLLGAGVLAMLGALVLGLRRYRAPTTAAVIARLDRAIPNQPLAALLDAQATGLNDPAAQALWRAHLRRMIAAAGGAKAGWPQFDLAGRDRLGLRHLALVALVGAAIFGQRGGPVVTPDLPGFSGTDYPLASWEGWATPPTFTGLPTLYLGDQPEGAMDLPEGTRIQLNLYDAAGTLSVEQTVSAPQDPQAPEQIFTVAQDGSLIINGAPGAEWDIGMLPDQPPEITLLDERTADADGRFQWPFTAFDDYAITGGHVTISLDLDKVERLYGLAAAPSATDPVVLDLPLPFTGARREITGDVTDTLSQHVFAGLPVTVQAEVVDAAGQVGRSAMIEMTLPGKRFFQPVARAIAEQRRDLLWSVDNQPRVLGLLRAIYFQPETLITNRNTQLRLSYAIRMMTRDTVDVPEVAQLLWEIAIQFEEGALSDARERLRRAQERLDEAMRSGASAAEIQELMDELRAATEAYLDMLAENMVPGESTLDQPPRDQGEQQTVTQDQIQALMDRIQELMNEGRMAEAAQLMEQLNELLENLQMQEGEGGESRDGEGQGGAMQDLQDTLRNQQQLSDETFRQMQEEFGRNRGQQGQQPTPDEGTDQSPDEGADEGANEGGQGQPGDNPDMQGQGGGADPDQPSEGGTGGPGAGDPQDGPDLGGAQRALRDQLETLRDALPEVEGESADRAAEALDRAEGAMENAERAIEQGNLPEAIDQQGAALDALREGMQAMREAINQQQQGESGEYRQGEDNPSASAPQRNDPLGRGGGAGGPQGERENAVPENGQRRADDILNELRRRAGERERAEEELDYLRRLLEE